MASKSNLLADISLKGLEIAPSQIRGAVRIVPLLRHQVRNDLRLLRRSYDKDLAVVSLAGEMTASGMQTRRVYLLSQLAEHNWNLDATASKLGNTREEFVLRLEKVGFGYLLNAEVRQAALKKVKRKR